MPHLTPFIVNDPGEGSQAKRRAQAVILDHSPRPSGRAGLMDRQEQRLGNPARTNTGEARQLGAARVENPAPAPGRAA